MKVSDYIVQFLISKGVTDIFGYPGGCISHLIDSASHIQGLTAHLTYHEQGAAFAACGYAQASSKLGVAYSTSGPGATNLITGIANAFFDSIPTLFITGQVDSPTVRGNLLIRQKGFQETDVISITKGITKWAYQVKEPREIRKCLEQACYIAVNENPGPVVLDIPNDIQRAEINPEHLEKFTAPINERNESACIKDISKLIKNASNPVFLFGNGVKQAGISHYVSLLIEKLQIPALFSLPAVDILPYDHPLNYGFIGGNGQRYANEILKRCDLLIAMGNRFSARQTGTTRQNFVPQAKLVRIDIDANQLNYHVRDNEISIYADLRDILPALLDTMPYSQNHRSNWLNTCNKIRDSLQHVDDEPHTCLISVLSDKLPIDAHVTADVGQNLLWTVRSFHIKPGQRMFMSAGHGAMGYSLPAAIGIYYATHKPMYAFCGDGGFMMNLQELQFVKRDKLPIKVICLNNSSLGMVRAWQGRYLNRHSQTTKDSGYQAPNIEKIAAAFDMKYTCIISEKDMNEWYIDNSIPEIIEICLPNNTETVPTGSIYRQLPEIDENMLSLF